MRWLKRYVRPLDYVIIVLLFIACFIPAGIFSLTEANVKTSQKVAVISVNGQVKRRIKLGAHTRHQQFTLYPAKGQYNIIEVDGERIRDKEDNSPDQIAVHTGWIRLCIGCSIQCINEGIFAFDSKGKCSAH